jgi:hypothetical protein
MPHRHSKAVHRRLHLVSPELKGADVRALQESINHEFEHRKLEWHKVKVDGVYGGRTFHACAFLGWVLGLRSRMVNTGSYDRPLTKRAQRLLRNPSKRSRRDRMRERVHKGKVAKLRHAHETGPKAAVEFIRKLASEGVHEIGETNTGKWVDKFTGFFGIHAVPWCGCLAGYAAKVIGGSTATTWFPYGPSIMADAQAGRNGVHEVAFDDIQAGDILVLWGGDHVVTAAGSPFQDAVSTAEGNTSPNDGDSQADGGCVAMKTRSRPDVSCAARPY